MKPVRLRFEEKRATLGPWLFGRQRGLARWAGAALLATAVASLLVNGWQLAAARQELASTTSELQAHPRRPTAAPPQRPTLTPQQRSAWSRLVQQLNTPWPELLAALEATTPQDVALVSVEPDARQATVRLQAEARSLDALLAYAQALKEVPPFGEVVPLKHETNEQDPNRPVRLTLNIWLRGGPAGASSKGEAR